MNWTRRDFLAGSGLGIAAGLLPTFACLAQPGSRRRQPNILFIVTDDQRPDSLGCTNRAVSGRSESPLGYVLSPNLDRLASEGVLFTNAFCQSPACAPSRASFHRGMYNHHIGQYGFEHSHNANEHSVPMIGEVLGRRGYSTAVFGKGEHSTYAWGPGLSKTSVGAYDVEIGFPPGGFRKTNFWKRGGGGRAGIAYSYHYGDGTIRAWYVPTDGPISAGDRELKERTESEHELVLGAWRGQMMLGGRNPLPAHRMQDARLVDDFERFLAQPGGQFDVTEAVSNHTVPAGDAPFTSDLAEQILREKGTRTRRVNGPDPAKPLLVNIGFHFPHTPVMPPQEFRDRFAGRSYRVPDFEKEVEYPLMPPQLKTIHDTFSIVDLSPRQKQQVIRDYYAFCAYGDHLVGRAVNAFKAYSARTDRPWLIVFACGDHGWHLGEQGIECKFGPWDKSTHDAIIVASSDTERFPRREVYDGLVEFVDIAPTIYAAAGVDATDPDCARLDGFDLARILREPELSRDYVIGEIDHTGGPRAYLRSREFAFSMRHRPDHSMVNFRSGKRAKERPGNDIRWGLDAPREAVEMALYDLRIDPDERYNVADSGPYRALADWFRQKLGRIVLGDGRIEVDWTKCDACTRSDFAAGAHDRRLAVPPDLIPAGR